jgi:hypothetical protein
MIALALGVTGSTAGFPAPAAALPVLGTALVLASGTGGRVRGLVVLTNPLAVRLGDLSYSLYLWHFPVIVLLPVVLPAGTPTEIAVAAGLTLVLAAASYRFVEEPVRRSRLLERRARRPGADRRRRAVLAGVVVTLVVAGGGAAVAIGAEPDGHGPTVARLPAASAAASPAASAAPTPTRPIPSAAALTALRAQLRTALAARSWPTLHPDVASVGAAARVTEWTRDDCLTVSPAAQRRCTWGAAGASRTVAVVGDSIALSWLPAVRGALEPAGYRVVALDMAQCPAAELRMADWDRSGTFAARCLRHLDWAVERIRSLRPALVLASSAPSTEWRLADGATGDRALAEWQRGQERLLQRIVPFAGATVVLDPPPPGKALAACDTRFSSPSDCASPLPGYLGPFVAASRRAAAATHALDLPTADWFCVAGRCPAFAGTTPVFADEQHLTEAYSKRLAPVLARALARARVAFVPGAPADGRGTTPRRTDRSP